MTLDLVFPKFFLFSSVFLCPSKFYTFIEQPELHLHPRAQSNLADLFIDVLSSRIDGKPRNIQLRY